MVFTRNKLDKYNETLLNKLVEFGGDITYRLGEFHWKGLIFKTSESMEKYMERENENYNPC